jgi:hypothetical protein
VTRETVCRDACHSCGGDVAVKKNVSGKAYYSCDHCGFKAQHTWQRTSDAYLATIAPSQAPSPAPGPAPAPTATPAPTPAPATRRSAGTVLG